MGLAFQVVDDILDVTADSPPWARRPAGRGPDKPTYVSLMLGLPRPFAPASAACRRRRRRLAASAPHEWRTVRARHLADMVVNRNKRHGPIYLLEIVNATTPQTQ